MHKHLPTLLPSLLNPLTDRLQLWFERIDPIITYALDIQDLDPPLALFYPERTLAPRAFPRYEMGVAARGSVANGSSRVCVCIAAIVVLRRDKRAFPDRDDVCDPERVEHIRIRCVIPEQNNQTDQYRTPPTAKTNSTHKFPR